jgi:hypothetical protein
VPSNRGVVYLVPGKVDVRNIDSYLPQSGRETDHSQRDPQGRFKEYLWLPPAYGTRPDPRIQPRADHDFRRRCPIAA